MKKDSKMHLAKKGLDELCNDMNPIFNSFKELENDYIHLQQRIKNLAKTRVIFQMNFIKLYLSTNHLEKKSKLILVLKIQKILK